MRGFRASPKNPKAPLSGPRRSEKQQLYPLRQETEELLPEALHKCFIGRRERWTPKERATGRGGTRRAASGDPRDTRTTFSFGGTDTDDERARLEILPRGQQPPGELGAKTPWVGAALGTGR